MDPELSTIDQILLSGSTQSVSLIFGIGVTMLGEWLADYFGLPPLPLIFVLSTLVIWTILPPTFGWSRADPTPNDFISSLKHVESSPDDCTICFDTCKTPVRLPCGHIECESCLRLVIGHNYESCSRCRKNFLGSGVRFLAAGSRWSVLLSKMLVCGTCFTVMVCFRDFPPLLPTNMYAIHICTEFMGKALQALLRDRHAWWLHLGAYQPRRAFGWALVFIVFSSTPYLLRSELVQSTVQAVISKTGWKRNSRKSGELEL